MQRESADLQDRILRRNQEIDTLNEQIAKLAGTADSELEKSAELKRTLEVALRNRGDRDGLKAFDSEPQREKALAEQREGSREDEQELGNWRCGS